MGTQSQNITENLGQRRVLCFKSTVEKILKMIQPLAAPNRDRLCDQTNMETSLIIQLQT